jgi:predicted nuclease with TOPRIM domain
MPAVKTAAKRTAKKPAPKKAKKVTLEDVWATIDRIGKAHEELEKAHRETEAFINKMGERVAEVSEHIAEVSKHVDKVTGKVDRVSANVGGLNRSMGELIETLIAARLWEKFAKYHYNLNRAYQRVPLYDEKNIDKTNIDILLSDTEWCMAVEVKAELSKKTDVDEHLKRMELIRKYPPAETVGKKLLGAMAGGVVDPDVRDYAQKCGFFVLELKGEAVRLIKPPKGFKPKEW